MCRLIAGRGRTMTKLVAQVAKFGVVGVVATVLDFLILYILADFIGLHYLTAAALAFVAATLFNYACSRAASAKPRSARNCCCSSL